MAEMFLKSFVSHQWGQVDATSVANRKASRVWTALSDEKKLRGIWKNGERMMEEVTANKESPQAGERRSPRKRKKRSEK